MNYVINEENRLLKSENILLNQKIKSKNDYIKKLLRKLKKLEIETTVSKTCDEQMTIYDFLS